MTGQTVFSVARELQKMPQDFSVLFSSVPDPDRHQRHGAE